MSINYNAKLVTDGLILNLDAANAKSYPGTPTVEVLIVGGGGGGGMDMGGGGGGGGVIKNSAVPITLGVGIAVTVGAGGWGAPAGGGGMRGDGAGPQPASHQFTIGATDGGNSSFGGLTAIGGGHGASSYWLYTPDKVNGDKAAGSGGSGGGMSGYTTTYSAGIRGGNGTVGQGYAGGNGGPAYYSGGGGGAGGIGTSSTGIPHGGIGVESSINGTSYYWGGGGGGAAYSVSPGGNGGNGGGGGGAVGTTTGGAGLNPGSAGGGGVAGAQTNTAGGNGGANTGGGGGGGSHYNLTNKGGDGGSGIVIIRYRGAQNATGGTITSSGGYTIHTFTSSGTFTPGATWNEFYNIESNSSPLVGTLNGISVANYTPSSGGLQSKAFVFPNGGTLWPSIMDSTLFDFRGEVSWDAVVCKENNSNRQSVWAQIDSASPWNGMGLIVVSHDSNGQLAWWGGNYITDAAGNWWDTGLSPSINKWVYIAGTWIGTTQKAYMREHGATSMSTATTTARGSFIGTAAPNSFRLGDNGTDAANALHVLDGAIAFVRIWRRKLSDAEVEQNFNSVRGRFGI